MRTTYGKHLIIDAYGVEEKKLKNQRSIKGLLKNLPGRLKMRALGNPVLKKIQSDDYPDWGLSGFVILFESHISVHTWPEENFVAMDVYSCKDFDEKSATKYIKNYWKSKKMKVKTIIRG